MRIVADLAVISSVLLWVGALSLAVLVFVLTRQVQTLHRRVAPAGALSVNQTHKVGVRAPGFTLETLGGGAVVIGEPGLR